MEKDSIFKQLAIITALREYDRVTHAIIYKIIFRQT